MGTPGGAAAALLPLRGSDSPDSFTFVSIHTRLVSILRQAATPDADAAAAINRLTTALERPAGGILNLLPLSSSSSAGLSAGASSAFAEWQRLVQERTDAGETFDDAPWFWVENYAFHYVNRAVGSACGFTPRGAPCLDPFAAQKSAALAACAESFPATILPLLTLDKKGPEANDAVLRAALLRSLWGNRHDLSLSGGIVGGEGAGAARAGLSDSDCLLSDDSAAAAALLTALPHRSAHPPTVSILLDNCGLELLADLALALLLARRGLRVRLICKAAPVFVSDALPEDIVAHVAWIRAWHRDGEMEDDRRVSAEMRAIGEELEASLALGAAGGGPGSTALVPHHFLSSPHAFWDMPADLRAELGGADLVIVKGDANYRRLLGDRHWPHDTQFSAATSYAPAPLLALRTLKAEVAVGVSSEAEARARATHGSGWLTSGVFGVVQLGGKSPSASA